MNKAVLMLVGCISKMLFLFRTGLTFKKQRRLHQDLFQLWLADWRACVIPKTEQRFLLRTMKGGPEVQIDLNRYYFTYRKNQQKYVIQIHDENEPGSFRDVEIFSKEARPVWPVLQYLKSEARNMEPSNVGLVGVPHE